MTNTIKLLAVASVFLASSAFAANPPAAPEPEAQPTVKAAPADLQAPAPVADVQDPALKLPVDLTPADKAQTADEPQPQVESLIAVMAAIGLDLRTERLN